MQILQIYSGKKIFSNSLSYVRGQNIYKQISSSAVDAFVVVFIVIDIVCDVTGLIHIIII